MVVIEVEHQYDAAQIMSRYNSKLIASRAFIGDKQYLVLESGPGAALLEIYIKYGVQNINGRPIT